MNMTLWRLIVVAILTALFAVGGWTTQRTATMTERHPTRVEFMRHLDDNNNRFNEIQKTLTLQQCRMEDKLDKIQEHLMGKRHKE